MPGPENTYQSYGTAWANLSNTPFRLYKHWIHEGGIATPLIVHWPNGIAERRAASATRPATCPTSWRRSSTRPARPIPQSVRGPRDRAARRRRRCCRCSRDDARRRPQADVLGARGQRRGAHRQVEAREALPARLGALRHGRRPHRAARPGRAASRSGSQEMAAQYDAWAERCGVIPREKIVALMSSQGVTRAFWEKDEALPRNGQERPAGVRPSRRPTSPVERGRLSALPTRRGTLAAWTPDASLAAGSCLAAPPARTPDRRRCRIAAVAALVLAGPADAREPPRRRRPRRSTGRDPIACHHQDAGRAKRHRKQVGTASVYARRFGGRKMADGTRLDLNDHVAASRTLPLGTEAKVTNLETGRSTRGDDPGSRTLREGPHPRPHASRGRDDRHHAEARRREGRGGAAQRAAARTTGRTEGFHCASASGRSPRHAPDLGGAQLGIAAGQARAPRAPPPCAAAGGHDNDRDTDPTEETAMPLPPLETTRYDRGGWHRHHHAEPARQAQRLQRRRCAIELGRCSTRPTPTMRCAW